MRTTLAALGTLLVSAGCSTDAEPARGQLMLVLGTDMAVPSGVDQVRAVVLRGPEVLYYDDIELAPDGSATLPGTFAIVAGDETPEISVEVTGFGPDATGARTARTFAKVVTAVPTTRLATLHMPVEWLCDGSVLAFGGDQFTSACERDDGVERACVGGECVPVAVDEATLPDYDPAEVFGGGHGPSDPLARCFDVATCFSRVRTVEPDDECSVEDPGTALNFGLRVSAEEGGICDETETPRCTVPLDRDERRGWRLREDGRIQLPPAVCERIANNRATVITSDICETKTPAYPTCGAWSSVMK